MKNLFLTIQRKYFEEILMGLKREEYRLFKPFFEKKLINIEYKTITFKNGYSKHSPFIIAEYLGYDIIELQHEFFGKEKVKVFQIKIGKLLKTKNLSKQINFKF